MIGEPVSLSYTMDKRCSWPTTIEPIRVRAISLRWARSNARIKP